MLKEHLTTLFTCYLMSHLFLIPIFILNFSGLLRSLTNAWQIRIHKSTVIVVMLLPIFSYLLSFPSQYTPNNNYEIKQNIQTKYFVEQLTNKPDATHNIVFSDSHKFFPNNIKSIILDISYFIIEYLLLITLLGFIYFFLKLILQLYLLKQAERHCGLKKSYKNLDIIFSSKISLPFSISMFKRKVYLPEISSPLEKQIMINHEFNHFRKNHHIWTILEAMFNYLFWYNPISYYLRVNGTLLREMECDDDTLKKTDRYTYSKLLVQLAETHMIKTNDLLVTQGLICRHTLRKRIENIMNKRISKINIGISILAVFFIFISASAIFLYGNINDRNSQIEILDRIKAEYAHVLADRSKVEIEKVPQNFIDALLVTEDRDFFNHQGIKIYNMMKASIFNLFNDREHWLGASTITQQLAKQFLDEPLEKTLGRKIREIKIAKVLEKNFTKSEILEMYLNSIYFGNNVWGLNKAAYTYFGHSYEKLTIDESTLLVPSIMAPTKYNPIENPELAKARQKKLMDTMIKMRIINAAVEKE